MTLEKAHRRSRITGLGKKAVKGSRTRSLKLKRSRDPLDPRGSAAYREASANAATFVEDPQRLEKLLRDAAWKTRNAPAEQFKETWPYLLAMIRVLRAYYRKEYGDIPRHRLATIISAVIYFVSPNDFIPDWLSGAGYLDDAFLVRLALESVKDDLDAFMRWEAQQI
jgi:uncharacterized membrane protein YkvA (DUF1232 family)